MARKSGISVMTLCAVFVGTAALGIAVLGTAGPAQAAGPAWWDLPTPAPVHPSALNAIAAVDARTAWTTGIEDPGPQTALFRWDGKKWRRDRTPVQLIATGVAGADARHAWAVGVGLSGPTAIFWNGTAWVQVAYPVRGVPVAVGAARDGSAWTVSGGGATSVLRWTGSAWAKVSVPLPRGASLTSVSVRTRSDVWLAGSSGSGKTALSLVMHWDGRAWHNMPVTGGTGLTTIDAESPTSVWATGASTLLHWNGRTWAPTRSPGGVGLLALTGDGGSGAWVVPYTTNTATRSYYLHWTGRSWIKVYGPLRRGNAMLGDISRIPGGRQVLAAGAVQETGRRMPFTEIYR